MITFYLIKKWNIVNELDLVFAASKWSNRYRLFRLNLGFRLYLLFILDVLALFCSQNEFAFICRWIKWVLYHWTRFRLAKIILILLRGTEGAELNPAACSIVCAEKQTEKPSVCIAGFTSASGPWQPTAECCWLIVRVCSRTELRYDDLYCSLISSLGFPLASSPHPPILFTVQPSIILPLSEGAAKLSGSWKQLFLYVWGDTTCSSDRLFSPHRSLVDGQADRLPPPPVPSPWGKWSCSLKSEVRYLSPKPQRDSGPLISLTYRWSKGAIPPNQWVFETCWNRLREQKLLKYYHVQVCFKQELSGLTTKHWR